MKESNEALQLTYDYMNYQKGHTNSGRHERKRKQAERQRHVEILKQRMLGAVLIAISIITPIIADGDATICLLTVPMGLIALFSKE